MFSSNTFSHSHIFDPEALKSSLKAIPTNRTHFYFESKTIHGFKQDLKEEIHDLLVELEASEDHLQRIIHIFLLYAERHEKLISEKDEAIFQLTMENEKNILKTAYNHENEYLTQENFNLLEKISQLSKENEFLDQQCSQYEQTIEELKQAQNKFEGKNNYEGVFIKYAELFKNKYPTYFCKCQGNYEEILKENSDLRAKLFRLSAEIQEIRQENTKNCELVKELNEEVSRIFKVNEKLMSEKEELKGELNAIHSKRDRFIDDITDTMTHKYRFHMPVLKIRSLSAKKKEEAIPTEKVPIQKKKKRVNNSLSLEKNTEIELAGLRTAVRHKTRAFTKKFTNLLSEIEKSLKQEINAGDNIFEICEDIHENHNNLRINYKSSLDNEELGLNSLPSNKKIDQETFNIADKEPIDIKEPLLDNKPKKKGKNCFDKLFSCLFNRN